MGELSLLNRLSVEQQMWKKTMEDAADTVDPVGTWKWLAVRGQATSPAGM